MLLQNIEITKTSYSADVDGTRHTVALDGKKTVAEAIEEIRAKLAATPAKKEKKEPMPVATKIDTD